MKLFTSMFGEIRLQAGSYHVISLESSYMTDQLRQGIERYSKGRIEEEQRFVILNEQRKEISAKELYWIKLNDYPSELLQSKESEEWVMRLLLQQLSQDEDKIDKFLALESAIEQFVDEVIVEGAMFQVQYDLKEKWLNGVLKQFVISLEELPSLLTNSDVQIQLINWILQLNEHNKPPFIVIEYPETGIGLNDMKKYITQLKKLEATVVVLSNHPVFIESAEVDHLSLVKTSGEIYDIISLQKELQVFFPKESYLLSERVQYLAYLDLVGEYDFLENGIKNFLMSSDF